MQFTRLRLNGFKSFVDPTELVIGDGLTGVVGPNGCGKSNLLEALRWVMGETRPKAMRGGGMEDVIFAGAASRPARNFAEVHLTLDNSDRLAPPGFNDLDQIEVIRRITRDVGSAFKANTKDVRARDVQMLFADASTGAHSPALVRQGQISELINAKPAARRRILEEAAGISGLYQRRHEAELKLKGAETNLTRVDDVLEALAAQLAQLARQAKQAARYREIGEGLRRAEGLLLYRRWYDAEISLGEVREAAQASVVAAAQAERAAAEAETARLAAGEALPPLREEDAVAAAILQRLEVAKGALAEEGTRAEATIDTLTRQVTQLAADLEREEALNADAGGSIARLEAEAADLTAKNEGQDKRLAEALGQAQAASARLSSVEAGLTEQTEDVARLAARHQSASRLIQEARDALTRHEAEASKARGIQEQARVEQARAAIALTEAQTALAAAQSQTEATEAAQAQTEAARTEVAAQEAQARASASAAEGELSALQAELTAIQRLVAREAGVGDHVLDALTVAPGWEAALGAALADDLRAPVLGADGAGSGWRVLKGLGSVPALPDGVVPLSQYVTAPAALDRRLALIGVAPAEQAAALQAALAPGQRLVSPEGDLFRWDGFVARAEDASSAAALRLQQVNRMQELKRDHAEASARATGTRQGLEVLKTALASASKDESAARVARRDADKALADAGRAQNQAERARDLASSREEAARGAVERHVAEAAAAAGRLETAEAGAQDLPDLDAARSGAAEAQAAVAEARQDMVAKRAVHEEMRRMGDARIRRLGHIGKEVDSWKDRLATADSRREEVDGRLRKARAELAKASEVPATLAAKSATLGAEIDTASARVKASREALLAAETAQREADIAARRTSEAAGKAREARAAAEARAEAAGGARDQAAARIDEDLGVEPADLAERLEIDTKRLPNSEALENDIARLRRQRDALGAVNLRAEEDAQEVATEHDTLLAEKHDLEEAIRTLRTGIASLNKEGRERLLAAFTEVNESFRTLFVHLFGGGEAKLELIESDDPLDAGLEIMCQPPGKKLSTLSLLSGGEQTLTALALIFAVFLANPAPICVLDEVDAPLDDANVTRFCDMLDEMTRRTDTRFLIITHHAITMSRMDRLFGVTMQEQGVSQLVSVDLQRAEALVA